jgi:hypothetical protein
MNLCPIEAESRADMDGHDMTSMLHPTVVEQIFTLAAMFIRYIKPSCIASYNDHVRDELNARVKSLCVRSSGDNILLISSKTSGKIL